VTHIAVMTASDLDGDLDLLALPEAVDPETWEVVIVHSDGSRTPPTAGGPGTGGSYPRFGATQREFKHWWFVDGFSHCHAEIHAPATGDREWLPLRGTRGLCPTCQARAAG